MLGAYQGLLLPAYRHAGSMSIVNDMLPAYKHAGSMSILIDKLPAYRHACSMCSLIDMLLYILPVFLCGRISPTFNSPQKQFNLSGPFFADLNVDYDTTCANSRRSKKYNIEMLV